MTKTPAEVELLAEAGRLLASVFAHIDEQPLAGLSTLQVNDLVETFIVATDDQVEYDVLVAVAEASVGLRNRLEVVGFVAELIKAAVARKEEPPFAVFDAKQVASARMKTASPPAALISSTTAAPFSSSTSERTQLAPSAAKSRPVSRPIPPAPPVMTAT